MVTGFKHPDSSRGSSQYQVQQYVHLLLENVAGWGASTVAHGLSCCLLCQHPTRSLVQILGCSTSNVPLKAAADVQAHGSLTPKGEARRSVWFWPGPAPWRSSHSKDGLHVQLCLSVICQKYL